MGYVCTHSNGHEKTTALAQFTEFNANLLREEKAVHVEIMQHRSRKLDGKGSDQVYQFRCKHVSDIDSASMSCS